MRLICFFLVAVGVLVSCTSTEIVESPKTAYVPEVGEPHPPAIYWTSRTLSSNFDYLGQVKARSFTYDGALERLIEGGKNLRADALIDVHYGTVGFLTTLDAFAIKFKKQ